jgi:uncharacterized protein YbcI
MVISDDTEGRIVEAVAKFEHEQMGLQPASILVNLRSNTLFVMLEGITFAAEKACAEEQQGQELLEKYYTQTFDAGKRVLEAELRNILHRTVERSTLRVDSVSGNGVLQFVLGQST